MLDFGLMGKKAVVCASSKGLGLACADALAQTGVNLVMCARGADTLEAAAEELRGKTGVDIKTVACDITTEEGRAAVLEAAGHVDILVNNAGGPPPGDFRDWTRDDWIKAIDANMLTAVDLIKGVIDPMIENKFGRIVNITSGSVKSPIPTLGLSNGARAGLTGFVGGLARQVARHNVTINGLLPGPFDTDRIAANINFLANQSDQTPEAVRAAMEERNPSGRIGAVEEFGFACAYICSAKSGFLVGQNILLDGGNFNSNG
ncbi:MAG: SDR family oxidoreductase [Alphaproteobacteria bacterium]|nr:SDR family oxidoreductase [Alphaproteobacteria bacterium]